MKKILGLDIGTNSIGWALVHEPTEPGEVYAIAGMGVRIIPLSSDENDEFTKGNAMSKNAGRTQKRGARRNLQRYKLRRHQLTSTLKLLGMMPDKELFELDALSLYGLRSKGVTGQLSLQEIGRVLYHLNQKRGYKSNRKANNDEEQTEGKVTVETEDTNARQKKKGYLDYINDREQALKDEGITIGQHFYNLLLKRETEQLPEAIRIKENIYLRSTYMDEFDRIWDKQQVYYPDILTDFVKQQIRDQTIYYQRPLRSQKGLVSNCLFEKHHKAAPKSSPLFQVNKIWQELNNIEITSFKAMRGREPGFDQQGKRKLTFDEKQRLFDQLNIKGKLTVKECLDQLGYKTEQKEYKLNIRNEKELEGNRTYSVIKKVFDKYKVGHDELLRFTLTVIEKEVADKQTGEVFNQQQVNAAFEQEPLFQLWHLLYSIEENETLISKLQSRYGFAEEVAKALAKIDFAKQGYGSLSHKAIRNIMPYLQQGQIYSEACGKVRIFRIYEYLAKGKSKIEALNLASYNHSNSLTDEQNANRELKDELKLIEKNELRQPVVEKILNQTINLVNEIIHEKKGLVTREERYSREFEIRVELARQLRQNAEERNKAFKNNSAMNKEHERIIRELQNDYGFKHVSRAVIEKYKLYHQFDGISIYTGLGMSLAKCLNGEGYDVDHIIPQSVLFDDSFQNKVLCELEINRLKDKTTGYDFMNGQMSNRFDDYVEHVKRLFEAKKISKTKKDKLLMSIDKIPQDFIERQMQETRFISKEVKKRLQVVCYDVHATSGTVTSRLRRLWGWDDTLMSLQINEYKALNKTEWVEYKENGKLKKIEKIKDWTKREDHRHHAIDALTIACTKQGYIQRISTLNSQDTHDEMKDRTKDIVYNRRLSLLEKYIISERPFDSSIVKNAVSHVLVSFKAGKRLFSNSANKIRRGGGVTKKEKQIIPRGFLHKDTIYGRIKQFEEVVLSARFDRLHDITRPEIKAQISEYIAAFDDKFKEAFNLKNLTAFKEKYGYDKVIVYRHEHVVRYKLDTNFKAADVEYIVDEGIKVIVKAHLAKYGNNVKVAFNGEPANTVWLNEAKGIPVKSVRCFTGYTDLQALHTNEYGEPIDFVSTRNNHHIAIYRDENGKLQENTVSFWDAVKRRQAKLPVIVKEPEMVWDIVINSGLDDQELMKGLPQPNWVYQTSLQQNEMFVFGITDEELEAAINANNRALISKHLYRTQKMSKKSSGSIDLWFRHHLETKLDDTATAKELKKFINVASLGAMNGIKVKVNNIGQIVKA